ncbi:Hypothetical predicted protein, partial [Olea europaea subsp. europaea]
DKKPDRWSVCSRPPHGGGRLCPLRPGVLAVARCARLRCKPCSPSINLCEPNPTVNNIVHSRRDQSPASMPGTNSESDCANDIASESASSLNTTTTTNESTQYQPKMEIYAASANRVELTNLFLNRKAPFRISLQDNNKFSVAPAHFLGTYQEMLTR